MRLTIKWEEFKEQIDGFVKEAEIISATQNSTRTEEEFTASKVDIGNWILRCLEFLKASFDIESNEFAQSFQYAKPYRFNVPGQNIVFQELKNRAFEELNLKMLKLVLCKQIMSVSDFIIRPEMASLSNRDNYNIDQTLELILDKLYDLYDNNFYSIPLILKGNGITLKRNHEDRELGKVLDDNGYVNLSHEIDTYAQLTIPGKMYIEKKRKSYQENYENINSSQEEINSKIDEIITTLDKLGCGHEVLFNEIQELKELYPTLNKKNWGQIVKGKLLDLSLAKLVENDTISYIYKTLTDNELHLL